MKTAFDAALTVFIVLLISMALSASFHLDDRTDARQQAANVTDAQRLAQSRARFLVAMRKACEGHAFETSDNAVGCGK